MVWINAYPLLYLILIDVIWFGHFFYFMWERLISLQYYTARKMPVYACFLDLSEAFDLVSYNTLWRKPHCDTNVSKGVVSILTYWYSNQKNTVKADMHSEVYRLECGLRQGWLRRLFKVYSWNLYKYYQLCRWYGATEPSISALRRLLCRPICELYAETHGLRYDFLR